MRLASRCFTPAVVSPSVIGISPLRATLLRYVASAQSSATSTSTTRAGNKKNQSGVSFDEETNTTTINEDAADVITASFGVQQSINPSWGWSMEDQTTQPRQQQEQERDNDDDVDVDPAAETENDITATTSNKKNVVEGVIVSTDGKEEVARRLDDEGMHKEVVEEIKRNVPPSTNPQEDFMLEFQRYYYKKKTQVGPFIGSTVEGEERRRGAAGKHLALRHRREIERVPKWEPPFEAAETSFRRLPPTVRIPSERQLRLCYPMKTDLPIEWQRADCADFSMLDIDEDPAPMKYAMLKPKNYDPRKPHPTMVWLSDHRGEECDFEDSCAHLFARGPHYESWYENGWVILAPCVTVRHAQLHAQEGVIARFCDWVVANHRVEHGMVHLAGKGLGAFAALRTVLEMKRVAISCTALLGRLAGPYRPLERPQEKAHNIQGTHVLMYVPGDMRKTEYVYKFKGFCDLAKVTPPVRAVHFADIRDHQVYYAVNPTEFWNYQEYFRTHNFHKSVQT